MKKVIITLLVFLITFFFQGCTIFIRQYILNESSSSAYLIAVFDEGKKQPEKFKRFRATNQMVDFERSRIPIFEDSIEVKWSEQSIGVVKIPPFSTIRIGEAYNYRIPIEKENLQYIVIVANNKTDTIYNKADVNNYGYLTKFKKLSKRIVPVDANRVYVIEK